MLQSDVVILAFKLFMVAFDSPVRDFYRAATAPDSPIYSLITSTIRTGIGGGIVVTGLVHPPRRSLDVNMRCA